MTFAAKEAGRSGSKILITGAHGFIGNLLYNHLAAQPAAYDVHGMARRAERSEPLATANFRAVPADRLRLADLSDFAALRRTFAGIDVVVHLAADSNDRFGWESLLQNNIVGAHNVFEAARLAGVKRVVFASTNQVVFGFAADEPYKSLFAGRFDAVAPQDVQPIDETQPTRPPNLYACSKMFGEALAYTYSAAHGLSCICLRIGWVTPDDRPPEDEGRSLWCSQRDIMQLIELSINAPASLRFDVFFGQSNNLYNLVDIQHARAVLGYAPQDSAEDRLNRPD